MKKFKKYLVPSMISMALLAIYTFTDSFVIGQKLGSVALGAMGICTPVITLTYAFAFLFPVLFGTASLWLATPAAELATSCVAILMSAREASKSMATP